MCHTMIHISWLLVTCFNTMIHIIIYYTMGPRPLKSNFILIQFILSSIKSIIIQFFCKFLHATYSLPQTERDGCTGWAKPT